MLSKFALRVTNRLHEARLNIATGGIAPAEAEDQVHYATVSYRCTQQLLRLLELTDTDVFVDIGCGKGRVVCLAARHKLAHVVGIEYSSTLAAIAERNVNTLRGRRTRVSIENASAETSDYASATVVYLFNPFEAPVLDVVLKKVRDDKRGRDVRIAFVMESEAQRDVFSTHTWLECSSRFVDADDHAVALYRNKRVAAA
jgi:SAM-dependent methyltransferase